MRAESYQPGDKIHFKSGSPGVNHIPHDSEATVLSTATKRNLMTVRTDNTQDAVTYDPAQLCAQSRERASSTRKRAKSLKESIFGSPLTTRSLECGPVTLGL